MILLNDWKTLARKAWSFRLAVLSAVLSAAEVSLQFMAPERASGKFAIAAMAVSLAAAFARVVAQPDMHEGDK